MVLRSLILLLILTSSTFASGWVFDSPSKKTEWVLSKSSNLEWVVPVSDRQVLFFTAEWCAACKVIKNIELKALKDAGWRVGEAETDAVRVIDIEKNPNLWKQYGSEEDGLPQFVCIYDGEVIRSLRSGCSTPMDAYGISWTFKGVDERPEPKRLPVTVDNNGEYPIRGNWWSVEGNWNASRREVIKHLLESPNHRELRPYGSMIKRMSRAEAHSLHSDHHEGRVLDVLQELKNNKKETKVSFHWPITITRSRSEPKAIRRSVRECPS